MSENTKIEWATLPYDEARCKGRCHPVCLECLRRVTPGKAFYKIPPIIKTGHCRERKA